MMVIPFGWWWWPDNKSSWERLRSQSFTRFVCLLQFLPPPPPHLLSPDIRDFWHGRQCEMSHHKISLLRITRGAFILTALFFLAGIICHLLSSLKVRETRSQLYRSILDEEGKKQAGNKFHFTIPNVMSVTWERKKDDIRISIVMLFLSGILVKCTFASMEGNVTPYYSQAERSSSLEGEVLLRTVFRSFQSKQMNSQRQWKRENR